MTIDEKVEEELRTYPPVDGKPGYVHWGRYRIISVELLRKQIKDYYIKKLKREGVQDDKI